MRKALSKMGARGVEPLLDAYSRSANRDTRHTLDYALAELGVRDPRILALLLDLLEDNPDRGAGLLGEYGVPDALPALESALDRFQIGSKGDGPFANHAVIELCTPRVPAGPYDGWRAVRGCGVPARREG